MQRIKKMKSTTAQKCDLKLKITVLAIQMSFAKLEEKINIPLFQERERERKREQESNKGHYQLLLHLYNDNE